MTDAHPIISFVVLTYNRSDALLKVLEALAVQCRARHEIIIADDGSCSQEIDKLKAGLPTFSCPVRHLWHPDKGFTASRARNLGGAASHGNYLVFLDGDCIPNPRFVAAHEALAQRGFFVNGSRVLLSQKFTRAVIDGEVNLTVATRMNWLTWRLQGHVNKLAHLLFWPRAPGRINQQFHWKQIRSCNFGLWRDDFFMLNGFDETFEGWGHEDADLVLRLHNGKIKRKNGFFSTEVYHLWHRQNKRDREHDNYQRVLSRLQSGLICAAKGLQDNVDATDIVVTPLN